MSGSSQFIAPLCGVLRGQPNFRASRSTNLSISLLEYFDVSYLGNKNFPNKYLRSCSSFVKLLRRGHLLIKGYLTRGARTATICLEMFLNLIKGLRLLLHLGKLHALKRKLFTFSCSEINSHGTRFPLTEVISCFKRLMTQLGRRGNKNIA